MTGTRFGRVRTVATVVTVIMGASALMAGAHAQNAADVKSVAGAAQPVDPGVRGGNPGAGGPLPGLNDLQQQYFTAKIGRAHV